MNIYKDFSEIDYDKETVITTGTFDGVHLGHQVIINRLLEISNQDNLRHLVITFEPHPQIVLQKDNHPLKLLTSISERIKLFESFGVKNLLIINFTREFSELNPEVFVRDYLVNLIGLKKVLIGYDHLFGKNRKGNENLLSQMKNEYDFSLETISALENVRVVVSSTKIRHALAEGHLSIANNYLGYKYFVDGKVVYGDRRGNSIGYPTANIQPSNEFKLLPANGVYLVKAIVDFKTEYGMANIGLRPTFTNNTEPVLEIFFFDFDKNIYAKALSVSFLKFVREEKKFFSLESFLGQLKQDEEFCRNLIPEFYY
ncbi:MAG: riboflavin biosynthesis protein RibF [Ignavibacteria bacterium]|nr:riboflavin biosynthesis protein RibF [Ignavibacteria bacterium]